MFVIKGKMKMCLSFNKSQSE